MEQKMSKLTSLYNVLDKNLGKGGMGYVWLCENKITKQKAAIKILKNEYTLVEKNRFQNEILNLQNINSKYVVKYYDSSFNENEQWISMEYVEGESLKQCISKQKYLDLETALDYAKMIAQALSDIHNMNLIHRDLKSSNVIISTNGDIKIIDFGISLSSESERLTKENNVIGTAEYLAPELIQNTELASFQSDMYSFGILLFEMLEGSVPFTGHEKLMAHINNKIPNLTRLNTMIPQSVQNIINKCCAKLPNNRYENMMYVLDDLKHALDKDKIIEKKINPDKKQRKSIIEMFENKTFTLGLLITGSLLLIITLVCLILLTKGII
ncbi:serine/threonine-protein kinase [Mycoplasma miroungirhinis]|uniref:Serine/threonine protein kinase n=1 Tax=Mycoplasma miroungirhinis TaxID=754516 RepID=A0A6M4JDR5_9MOLU|nr:serine/threonine-protein kinase [Mycoplasma miroungirhinis]QJR44227.1 serine/threonine protein kinase [Mycoplasma miroungirhinis]